MAATVVLAVDVVVEVIVATVVIVGVVVVVGVHVAVGVVMTVSVIVVSMQEQNVLAEDAAKAESIENCGGRGTIEALVVDTPDIEVDAVDDLMVVVVDAADVIPLLPTLVCGFDRLPSLRWPVAEGHT